MAHPAQSPSAGDVVGAYFQAIARRDLDGLAAMWAPDGVGHVAGQGDNHGPEGARAYFAEVFGALPDLALGVVRLVGDGDRVAVLWHATGTFAGTPFQGIAATGGRLSLDGLDLIEVRDGLIVRNDVYLDALGFARQLGLLPGKDSPAERRLNAVFNARTRAVRRVAGGEAEPVAAGVWVVRGGYPVRGMNVYLVADELGGVTVFDAGIRTMAPAILAAAASRGGINRVVLGHGHPDHRGAAPRLGAPVYDHPLDRADAEGDGGMGGFDFGKLGVPARWAYPHLLRSWDGGPVAIAGTLEDGDEVAGFRVVHLPGHAPGLIALFRERDGVALTSDVVYTVDPETSRPQAPRVPHPAFNQDTEQARASIRALAALAPQAAWPGHGQPLEGDVRAQLEQAAARA